MDFDYLFRNCLQRPASLLFSCEDSPILPRIALLPLSFVLVPVVVLLLEKTTKPYSVLDGGTDHEKIGGRRSRRTKSGPVDPLRFEDDRDDENDLVVASPR